MSRIDVQKYNISVGNNAQNMLPVPITKNPSPTVPSDVDYGQTPYAMPLKPSSRKDDDLQYCNFLQPAPRDQRLNVPYEGNKNCSTFKPKPFNKDSCYLMDSKSQGTVGIVCNEAGGSDNANFVRGNQFGVDYEANQYSTIKTKEYTIEQPVQIPMELQNPLIVNDQSTFYPETNFYIAQNRKYKTYPKPDNYTTTGFPVYRYPYKVLNKRDSIDNIENSDINNMSGFNDSINNLNNIDINYLDENDIRALTNINNRNNDNNGNNSNFDKINKMENFDNFINEKKNNMFVIISIIILVIFLLGFLLFH